MNTDITDAKTARGWKFSYLPFKDPLALALMPREALTGRDGRRRIEAGMCGVRKHTVESIDGFGYNPNHTAHLDINLVMLASEMGNVPLLRHWIDEVGVDPNVRNASMWTALIFAIATGQGGARDYLLGADGIEIGLPEAAALGMRDRVPRLVSEYDARPQEEKLHGLAGSEVALIFSGLSGDIDWVLSLMGGVLDVNVGGDCDTDGVGMNAVRSGNTALVRKLVQEHGVILMTPYDPNVLFAAIHDPKMLQFLLEELQVSSLDAISETRCTLMESALLNRATGTVEYLLQKRSAEEWSSRSHGQLLHHSIFLWNAPKTTRSMLPTVSPHCAQAALRQALQYDDMATVRALVEGKGANLSETKEKYTTMLEVAIHSGSLDMVTRVLGEDRNVAKYKHKNGFNVLVAAARQGSGDVFEALAKEVPEFLDSPVWDGMSLLMVACQYLSSEVVGFLLEESFYESLCRGKTLDANTQCENKRTALWYAASSGFVPNVDKLLSRKDWLGLKELNEQSRVNELFMCAAKSECFAELLDCFARHGLALEGTPSASLSMAAAENGALFTADPSQLKRLRALDASMGVEVPDEVLLCAVIKEAPEWAVDCGRLADLIGECFLSEGVLKSSATLEQVLLRCDRRSADLFDSGPLSAQPLPQLILKALKEAGINKKDRVPVREVTQRRSAFIRWLIRNKLRQEKKEPRFDGEQTHKIVSALIEADLRINAVESEVKVFHSSYNQLASCSSDQLISLLKLATKFCQVENVKRLCASLSSIRLSTISCEKEGNLIHTALCHEKVSDVGRKSRMLLVQWLVTTGGIDLEHADSEGTTPIMAAARMGDARIYGWIARNVSRESLAAQDDKGCNLVHHAVKGGHIAIVEHAAQAFGTGACGQGGETPLHVAAASGDLAMLRYLVEVKKVDTDARDIINRTALDYCMFGSNTDSRDYLESVFGTSSDDDDPPPSKPRDIVHKWLEEISRSIGKSLGLNSEGICAFTYEDHTIVIEVPFSQGSMFMYASFGGRNFAIEQDSWEMLLANAIPGVDSMVCPGMEQQGSGKSDSPGDVTLSVSDRIEELDSKRFRNVPENFIDAVVVTAERLRVCAAKRYLKTKLSRLLPESDGGAGLDRVLEYVQSFAVDRPKGPSLDSQDLALFKQALAPHVEAIGRSVKKNMSVNTSGQFAFTYDNLTICVEPASAQKMLLTSTLWDTGKDGPINAAVLRQALELNYLQQQTRGGLLSLYSASGTRNELFFMYEDSVNLSTVCFRNILENFIDTALDMYKRVRKTPKPLHQAFEDLERDLRQRQVTIINEIRRGDFTILERIFALGEPSLIQEKLDSLAFTIMDTRDMELWRCVVTIIFALVNKHGGIEVDSFRKSVFRRMCEKDMFDDDLLCRIADGAPDSFELDNLTAVFSSKKLLQDKRIVSTAQKLIDLHRARWLKHNEDPPEQILDNWTQLLSNVLSSSTKSDSTELIACLDWIFSRTKEGELDEGSNVTSLLHNIASLGLVDVVRYLLQRLPHIGLDEATLLWACKQDHADLAVFIVSQAKDLPRTQAIKAAAASGSIGVLKALEVGTSEEGILAEEIENGELSNAIAIAAQTAMSNGNWAVLQHVLTDQRLKTPLAELMRTASVCSRPKKAIQILLESCYAAQQVFSCLVPWQAQAIVLDSHVMVLLRVMVACKLPAEVGGVVWSFLRPDCEATPVISSSSNFLQRFQKPLERDLGIGQISHEGNTFLLPGIGSLSFQKGLCCVKKRFETSEICIKPDIPLGMSLQLGGCFLASRDLDSALWLKRIIPMDDSFDYNELRLMLHSFRKVAGIVDNVLSNARKFNVMVPAQNLPAFAPSVQIMNKVRTKSTVKGYEQSFDLSYFANSKWVRITTPCNSCRLDAKLLLEANMVSFSDETFFCMGVDGAVCGAMYARPNKLNDGAFFGKCQRKLANKAKNVLRFVLGEV